MSDEPHAVDALRKLDAASLKVTLQDGTTTPVAVPKIRNRWQRVIQVLDSLPWVRVDALDKSGAVLGSVEDEVDDADLLEDDDQGGDGKRDIKLARVLLEVMRSTQKESRQMYEAQMRGQAALVDAFGAAIKSISATYEANAQIQRATVVAEAAGQSGNPEVMTMLQLALGQLMQPPKLPGGSK